MINNELRVFGQRLFSDEFYLETKFGVHKGNVANSGFLFRAGLGYQLKINEYFKANFILTYSFQNIYKDFLDSGRPDNYYNLEGVGLTIGFELR